MSTHSCHWVQHKLQEWALWKAQLQMTYGETQPGQRPRDCISQMAYLLGKTGKKKHLASKSLEPLAVCAPAESYCLPDPSSWDGTGCLQTQLPSRQCSPWAESPKQFSWLCLHHSDTQVCGSPSDTSVTAAFLPFLRLTQSTWAFHTHVTAQLCSWPAGWFLAVL